MCNVPLYPMNAQLRFLETAIFSGTLFGPDFQIVCIPDVRGYAKINFVIHCASQKKIAIHCATQNKILGYIGMHKKFFWDTLGYTKIFGIHWDTQFFLRYIGIRNFFCETLGYTKFFCNTQDKQNEKNGIHTS